MGRRKTFTDKERGIIAGHVASGWGARRIARKYKWKRSSVQVYVSQCKKYGTTVNKKKNCGRKRKTDERTDRLIANAVLGTPEKRRKSSKDIVVEYDLNVSSSTVRRRLIEKGLTGSIAKKKPYLRPANVKKRLDWAKEHVSWTEDDWDNVLWSDESPFLIFGGKTRSFVRRRQGESLHPHCVDKTVKHGGGKINIWGCFSSKGVGKFTKINGIMDKDVYKKILVHHAKPSMKQLGTSIFQQDNDPKHTAKKNLQYLTGDRWKASLLKWPAQSPDLNPIENLWQYLDFQVRKRHDKPKNEHELFHMLKEEWENLDEGYLRKLVHSMPKRCQEVINAKGYWTKY